MERKIGAALDAGFETRNREFGAMRRWAFAGALAIFVALGALLAGGSWADSHGGIQRTPAPEGASLYFISPADGGALKSPVHVRFGLSGMGVAPAGIEKVNTGHHHLLVDTPLPENLSMPVPTDENHRHFGGGQTEIELELAPGKHTLQLLLADHRHIPFDPVVASKPITIHVE